MFKKTKSFGKEIADRIMGYTVWEKLPRKTLKRHPTTYVICPDFKIAIPKILTKEAREISHTFTIRVVSKSHSVLREALDHVVQCAQEDVIINDKRIMCCGHKESIVKIGGWKGNLTFTFKLRQLSSIEIKEIKKSSMMEENHG